MFRIIINVSNADEALEAYDKLLARGVHTPPPAMAPLPAVPSLTLPIVERLPIDTLMAQEKALRAKYLEQEGKRYRFTISTAQRIELLSNEHERIQARCLVISNALQGIDVDVDTSISDTPPEEEPEDKGGEVY